MAEKTDWPIQTLAWLADAPLFIDRDLINSFYDAVVRPESKVGNIVLSSADTEAFSRSISGHIEGSVGLAEWLRSIFPAMDIKIGAEASGSRESSGEKTQETTIELHAIDTPQRQLVQLALHYTGNLRRRLAVVNFSSDLAKQLDRQFIEGLPRGLVFIDFPRGTKFIPMMAEVGSGKAVEIFKTLKARLAGPKGGWPPEEPDERLGSREEMHAKWTAYWNWYEANFNAAVAMETVEAAIEKGGGRVQWIDYRVPFAEAEKPLHLHISGRERFDTGVFAYNLIKRGSSHGLRMVGTVRSGPSLNVLAIFEK